MKKDESLIDYNEKEMLQGHSLISAGRFKVRYTFCKFVSVEYARLSFHIHLLCFQATFQNINRNIFGSEIIDQVPKYV